MSLVRFTKCEDKGGDKMNATAVGARIRDLRGSMAQKKVAEDLGVLQSTYSMYESGQRIPSDEVKIKIANYFKKTVQEIFFAD